ncbi:MAG: hypothetical protein EAZ32_09000 [Cytophagia bacterium]|nr:MAG: hypothetical protein EAZ46_05070 [Runella sp.]TAG20575.1 MAG: hypothetical protein EAZ38_10040 [Cytophagales bacterium]TAG39749.1 MAG: hypothetical protein EAZ32_09000 [Cytophagia bacterium]TAG81375.1 MAG: hypothetical protein EAZ22_07465 [Cytophagales bacterium]
MAEFQLYDFRRIDKPLSAEERKQVESLSSHISVSSRRAVVSYSYGDFKHDEEKVVAQYFDALLYQTNWGQKKLLFRFPKDSIDTEKLEEYFVDMGRLTGYTTEIRYWETANYVLLNIEYCDDDFGDWVEETDNSLDSLLDLRTEMMSGDFSCLYAFWLKLASMEAESDDDDEPLELPAIPTGLAKPSSALKSFIDFFEVDARLVKAASSFVNPTNVSVTDVSAKIATMSDVLKNEWLTRLLEAEPLLDIKLKKYLLDSETGTIETTVSFAEIRSKL